MKTGGFGPSGETRYISIPDGNGNQGVAAVKPAASNCPPDSCIELFESRPIQSKNPGSAKAESGFLVRVARLELAASWSQTRRPTNWATPG